MDSIELYNKLITQGDRKICTQFAVEVILLIEDIKLLYIIPSDNANENLVWRLVDMVIKNRYDVTIKSDHNSNTILILKAKEHMYTSVSCNVFDYSSTTPYTIEIPINNCTNKVIINVYATNRPNDKYHIVTYVVRTTCKGEAKGMVKDSIENCREVLSKYGLNIICEYHKLSK